MGYTDAHGRPEIEPGDWFGNSPARPRRTSTTRPAPTVAPTALEEEIATKAEPGPPSSPRTT